MPIAPLFSTQLRELLLENVSRSTWVEASKLDDVDCDHVAFDYGDDVGVQFWIPQQGVALPRRVVMNFETARGRPQFRADFRQAPRVAFAAAAQGKVITDQQAAESELRRQARHKIVSGDS